MEAKQATRISKLLSFWLRHNPADAGLGLDDQGWTDIALVLQALSRRLGRTVARDELETVVATSDKQRFAIQGNRIRANQGHSVAVALDFRPVTPPDRLFHGTTEERWEKIRESGLKKMRRHHVHLSPDEATARRVAGRHRRETPLVLMIDAARLMADGQPFYISDNGVYLTDEVPASYLTAVRSG